MRRRDFDGVADVLLEDSMVVLLDRLVVLSEELREASIVIGRACAELRARRVDARGEGAEAPRDQLRS